MSCTCSKKMDAVITDGFHACSRDSGHTSLGSRQGSQAMCRKCCCLQVCNCDGPRALPDGELLQGPCCPAAVGAAGVQARAHSGRSTMRTWRTRRHRRRWRRRRACRPLPAARSPGRVPILMPPKLSPRMTAAATMRMYTPPPPHALLSPLSLPVTFPSASRVRSDRLNSYRGCVHSGKSTPRR